MSDGCMRRALRAVVDVIEPRPSQEGTLVRTWDRCATAVVGAAWPGLRWDVVVAEVPVRDLAAAACSPEVAVQRLPPSEQVKLPAERGGAEREGGSEPSVRGSILSRQHLDAGEVGDVGPAGRDRRSR